MLNNVNPFIEKLVTLGEMHAPQANVHLRWNHESSEIATIYRTDDDPQGVPRRQGVLIHCDSTHEPTFVHILDGLYEPLQYPLLFLMGERVGTAGLTRT